MSDRKGPTVSLTPNEGKGIPDEVARLSGQHDEPLTEEQIAALDQAAQDGKIKGFNFSYHHLGAQQTEEK